MKMPFAFPTRLTATFACVALALAGTSASFAEDVDIFTAGAGTTSKPNVLIILDSSSNWSASFGANSCNTGNMATNTKFASEMCALKSVVAGLDANVRLGLMLFAESGLNGGYVRYAIRDMTPTNKTAFQDMVSNFVNNGLGTDNSGSNQPYAKTMFEAFKYFGGGTGSPQDSTHYGPTSLSGGASNNSGSYRRDYNGNTSGSATAANATRAAPKYGADANNAFTSSSSNTYVNPITDNCAKNFIIFISNGNPSVGGDSGADTLLNNIGGDASAAARVKTAGVEVHASLMDEFAKHLNSIDVSGNAGTQKIITYTIAVYPPGAPNTSDQSMIKLMKSAATVGGGKYFAATQASDVTNALLTILNEVQAVNSVFVSASLPVSVNTQGTFLNQVYMGLFRPDGSGSPKWLGNVKQYKFKLDSSTGDLSLADSANATAVNPATGFISPNAVSYWTAPSTFWSGNLTGIPPSASDKPDGDVVEKGGAAQVQRTANLTTQANRKLYTCPAGTYPTYTCPTSGFGASEELKNANISFGTHGTAFGAADATDLTRLIDWIRGEDNASGASLSPYNSGTNCNRSLNPLCSPWDSAELGPGWPNTVRPSIHGDVLHSRPVVINFVAKGSNTSVGPHMFYASNDGVLRGVKGGQAATDGSELWGFLPPEFYGKYRRLRYATPELRTPGTPPGLIALTAPKDYFFDGPIGTYEDNTTTPETKWIFVGARRGGAVIYAFDVSIPTTPKFMWKHTGTTLPNLGQTWSLPVAFKIPYNTPNNDNVHLVFGGGYDVGEDASPGASTGKGHGIYVLDAKTGAERRFISSTFAGGHTVSRPIASDIGFLALANPSGIGFTNVYRGYVGDLGGNVWRLDISADGNPANWRLFKFAALGAFKFLYAPDLVKAGAKDIVLIGSGDREKPLVTTSVDRFFGLWDTSPAPLPMATTVDMIGTGDVLALSGTSGSTVTCASPENCGWYRQLATGEKVVNSPLTVAGVTFFATNLPTPPAAGTCDTNLGEAKTYGISFLAGGLPAGRTSISTVLTGGGLAPSPVAGVVDLGKPDGSEGGQTVSFCIGCGKKDRLEPERPIIIVPLNRQKIYWNMKNDA